VFVDGVEVWGFIDSEPTKCGHTRIYAERYDAYFCPVDNRWDTAKCGDASCKACALRGDRPFDGPLDEPADPSAFR